MWLYAAAYIMEKPRCLTAGSQNACDALGQAGSSNNCGSAIMLLILTCILQLHYTAAHSLPIAREISSPLSLGLQSSTGKSCLFNSD